MKPHTSLFATVLALAAVFVTGFDATAQDSASLKVRITNIETIAGTMRIGVFDSERSHTSDEAITGASVPVEAADVTAVFDGLAPGSYSLKVFQDVDDNGKLATGLMGIPKEPWGISNDAPASFGPPKWEDAEFAVLVGENQHTIALR